MERSSPSFLEVRNRTTLFACVLTRVTPQTGRLFSFGSAFVEWRVSVYGMYLHKRK